MPAVAKIPPLRVKKKAETKSVTVRFDTEHKKMLDLARMFYSQKVGKKATVTDVVLAAIKMMLDDLRDERRREEASKPVVPSDGDCGLV